MFRTMWCRKLSAERQTARRCRRATTRAERTVQVGVRSRPAAAQNALKSCLPRTARSPAAIAAASSGKRDVPGVPAEEGIGLRPRSIR